MKRLIPARTLAAVVLGVLVALALNAGAQDAQVPEDSDRSASETPHSYLRWFGEIRESRGDQKIGDGPIIIRDEGIHDGLGLEGVDPPTGGDDTREEPFEIIERSAKDDAAEAEEFITRLKEAAREANAADDDAKGTGDRGFRPVTREKP